MTSLSEAVTHGFAELIDWLERHQVEVSGPRFVRYLVIDMMRGLEIEVAAPVGAEIEGDSLVRAGTLPRGRYATLLYTGPYEDLVSANAAVQDWAQQQGLSFDTLDTDRGSAWGGRVERYLNDPKSIQAVARLETEVAYLLRD